MSTIPSLKRSYIHGAFDTKQPLNLNDADFFPDSIQPLQACEVPTEMAFGLIANCVAKFMVSKTTRNSFERAILAETVDCEPEISVLEYNMRKFWTK